ncbi:MAG: transporter [Flavobacterium sp.]
MKKQIIYSCCIAVVSAIPMFGQHTDVINSNRPGESMTAFSVGKKVFQLESGIYYHQEDHRTLEYDATGFGLNLDVRFGYFLEQLEFIVNSQFQMDKYNAVDFNESRSGFRNLNLGAKYLVYDPFKNYEEKPNLYSWKANQKFKWRRLIPAVAVYGGAQFSIGDTYFLPDQPSVSPRAMVITQQHITNQTVFVTNIFANQIGTDFSQFGFIATLTLGFNDKWSGFWEFKGIKSDYYSDSIITAGAAYLLMPNFQLDASISKNFKDTPDLFYGGIGFSWRIDDKHEPVRLEDKGSGPEEKRAGKKKDKKKRKDAIELENP